MRGCEMWWGENDEDDNDNNDNNENNVDKEIRRQKSEGCANLCGLLRDTRKYKYYIIIMITIIVKLQGWWMMLWLWWGGWSSLHWCAGAVRCVVAHAWRMTHGPCVCVLVLFSQVFITFTLHLSSLLLQPITRLYSPPNPFSTPSSHPLPLLHATCNNILY